MGAMSRFLPIDPGFRARTLRRHPGSGEWLDRLPQLWSGVSRRWGLVLGGIARTGGTSVVLPAVEPASGRRMAVKLVGPAVSAEDEATALTAFRGRGAVELLDADLEARVLLLEWLDGPSLRDMPNRSEVMRTAGEIAARLATAAAPAGAPRLAAQASEWLDQLHHHPATVDDLRRIATAEGRR